jgi:iron-sulfur cluster repair protein YtfE (RIC family)
VILSDLSVLSESDGAKEWKEKEAKDLTDYIMRRFHKLQVSGKILLDIM